MTLVAYLFVLGAATPVFRVAYLLLPGMKLFRFPTRFLIVVELGLALLGAVGLTRLGADLERRWTAAVASASRDRAGDLRRHGTGSVHPSAAAESDGPGRGTGSPRRPPWTSCGPTVRSRARSRRGTAICTAGPSCRAHGWANVDPYFELRDVLEPNTGGGFWNMPSADCYAGIAARWYVDVWGDHNREALARRCWRTWTSTRRRCASIRRSPRSWRRTASAMCSVRSLSRRRRLRSSATTGMRTSTGSTAQPACGSCRAARRVKTDRKRSASARLRLRSGSRDPAARRARFGRIRASTRPDARRGERRPTAAPVVTHEDSRQLVIDADAPEDGFLLLADTFYPGWTAHVDGAPTPIYRANISVRGIRLPKGRHEVRFIYDAHRASCAACRSRSWRFRFCCSGWAERAYMDRRARRYATVPSEPQNPITM